MCDETGEGVRRPMATVLLIMHFDDEEQVRMFFQIALEDASYRVLSATDGKEGLRLLHDHLVDVILVDIFMLEKDGRELIPLLRKTRPASKIIAISGGLGERNDLGVAPHLGANATLTKPFSLHELTEAVASQLT
jgi:DNA-binding response OmpR family regulator